MWFYAGCILWLLMAFDVLPSWGYITVFAGVGMYAVYMVAALSHGEWCHKHNHWEPKVKSRRLCI